MRKWATSSGDLAGDACGLTCRVQRLGVGPDALQPLDHIGIAKVLQTDAEAFAVGEVGIGAARPGEIGIDLEHIADVADDDEGRGRVVSGQAGDIVLGLTPRITHQHIPATFAGGGGSGFNGLEQGWLVIALGCARLLCLKNETATFVKVDAQSRGNALGLSPLYSAFKNVVVCADIVASRIRPWEV
jgi:hypothetical protein